MTFRFRRLIAQRPPFVEPLEVRRLMSGEPKVVSSEFHFNTAPHEVRFTFDQDVSASLAAADLILKNIFTAQTVPTGSTSVSWNAATKTATFSFPGYTGATLPDGNYLATLNAPGITNGTGQALVGDHDFEFYFWNGDFDHDRDVDLDDQNILASNFNGSGRNFSQGDASYDGLVNLDDFNIMGAKFNTRLAEPAAPGEISVTATSASTITLQWPIAGIAGEEGWRLQISTDGQNFVFLTNLAPGTSSHTVSGLQDGTRYWFRVRAYGNGKDTAYSPKKAATTSLPPPMIDSVGVLNSDGDVRIAWTANSQNHDGFVITRYQYVAGEGTQSQPDAAVTVGDVREYVFTDTLPNQDYVFTVHAKNDASGAESAPSLQKRAQRLPASDLTPVYSVYFAAPDYVGASWDPPSPYVLYYNDTNEATLTITNLPKHSHIIVGAAVNLTGPAMSVDGTSTMTVEVDGGSLTASDPDRDPGFTSWRFGERTIKHTSDTLTIKFRAESVPDGWLWAPVPEATTYFPFVSLSGSGTVEEDGNGSATFTAHRSGSGAVLQDALTVYVRDSGGSVPDAATEGADYEPIVAITIPAGANEGTAQVVPIDDPDAEGIEPIYQSVAHNYAYALAAEPATAPATNATTQKAELDDEARVESIKVSVLPEVPQQRDVTGFAFGVRVLLNGEALQKVVIKQDIYAECDMLDQAGQALTPAQVRQNVQGDPNTVHSNFQWVADTAWHWAPLAHVDAKGGTAYTDDLQKFQAPFAQFQANGNAGVMAYLTTLQRFFKLEARVGPAENPGAILNTLDWGYRWSNSNCKWQNNDAVFGNPPANLVVAVSPVPPNERKGSIYG